MPPENKETLIRELQQMKAFEKWAGDFYLQVASNPKIENEEVKNVFERIAGDEERHTKIVQKIINIIRNNL